MSIISAREEIRGRRRVVEVASGKWQVLSTAGDYHHEISYSFAFMDFQCDTCMSRFGNRKCWARRRVIEFVQSQQAAQVETSSPAGLALGTQQAPRPSGRRRECGAARPGPFPGGD